MVVGVNKFTARRPRSPTSRSASIRPSSRSRPGGWPALRSGRDGGEFRRRLDELKKAAAGSQNVLVPLRETLRARATVGEVCDALRDVWGTYRPPDLD